MESITSQPLLICKLEFGQSKKRISLKHNQITLDHFKERIRRCFSLAPTSLFRIAYKDDDGDTLDVSSEEDLYEAISYFSDDDASSSSSFSHDPNADIIRTKITMKLVVIVEYDGPSLSEIGDERSDVSGSRRGLLSSVGGSSRGWDYEDEDGRSSVSGSSSGSGSGGGSRISRGDDHRGRRDSPQGQRQYEQPPYPPYPYPSYYSHPAFSHPSHPHQIPHQQQWSSHNPYNWPPPPRPPLPLHVQRHLANGNSRLDDSASETSYAQQPPGRPAPTHGILNGIPSSSPPTYRSKSAGSNRSGSGQEVDLNRRWLDENRRRVNVHGATNGNGIGNGHANGKGKKKEEDDDSLTYISERTSTTNTSSSSSSSGGEFPYSSHLNPHPSTSTSTQPDLPTILSSLALSRRSAPPSILSSLPDDQLSCSSCRKVLDEFRYVCSTCGPRLPEGFMDDDSDDGTHIGTKEEEEEEEEMKGKGKGKEKELFEDPLGVLEVTPLSPTKVPLPLSPLHSSSSPRLSPPLSALAPIPNPTHDIALLTDLSDESDRKGFELCAECIYTEGVRHANEMSRKSTKGTEVRHAFREVVRVSGIRGEWREVDCEDDVECTICKTAHLQTNRFKCASCPQFELCLSCYRTVEEIHPVHSFLAVPDRPAHPQIATSPPVSSEGHPTEEDMRNAVLRARFGSEGDRGSYLSSEPLLMPPRPPPKPLKHPGVLCFGCLGDIVGPRFTCSECHAFDLCSKCEQREPPVTSPDGRHDETHILLKLNRPVNEDVIDQAGERARMMSRDSGSSRRRRSSPNGRYRDYGPPPPPWDMRYTGGPPFYPPYDDRYGPPPHPPPHYFGAPHQFGGPRGPPGPPPQPPVYLINSGGLTQAQLPNGTTQSLQPLLAPGVAEAIHQVIHNVLCKGCDRYIQGIRWLCAQCGTRPTYDLCSSCESSAHVIHDPLHAFLRITRPLQQALPPLSQLLPVLYDPTSPPRFEAVSSGSSSGSGSDSDSVVLHNNVVCDNCLEVIVGSWMRCCHCATSFDICQTCLSKIQHDYNHVFLKLSRKIDFALFRDLTRLSTSNPQALLSFSIHGP